MALLIHREIKDEQVIPLAKLNGLIGEKISFEEALTFLQNSLNNFYDIRLSQMIDQLVNEDEDVKAKKAELESLIQSKRK